MKLQLTIACLVLSTVMIAQRKVYNLDGNKKVKGTFAELTATSHQPTFALIPSGTIAATIGPAIIKSGIGLIRTQAEKKQKLATATFTTNSVSFMTDQLMDLSVISTYYPFSDSGAKQSFQTLNLSANADLTDSLLKIELINMTGDYCRAYVKSKRNMLLYEVTINGNVSFFKKGERADKTITTSFLFAQPEANSSIQINQKNDLVIPQSTESVTLSITVKEVNPYFHSSTSLASFLENYGDSVAEIFAGLLIEPED